MRRYPHKIPPFQEGREAYGTGQANPFGQFDQSDAWEQWEDGYEHGMALAGDEGSDEHE